MSDEQLKEQASLYVAGALPAVEAAQFEEVLRSNLELQLLVKQLRLSVDALAAALPRRTPPPMLRARLLRQVEQRAASAVIVAGPGSSGPFWIQLLPWALAACFMFLCVVLFSRSHTDRDRVRQLELDLVDKSTRLEQSEKRVEEQLNEARQQRNEYTQKILQQAAEQLKQQAATETRYLERVKQIQREKAAAPVPPHSNVGTVIGNDETARNGVRGAQAQDATPAPFPEGGFPRAGTARSTFLGVLRPKAGFTGVGAVAWEARDQKGTVVIEQLAPSTADRDYQLWLFTEDGRIVSGGLLKVDTEGHLTASYACNQRIDAVTGFKVTLERAGGVEAPGQGSLVLETN